MTTITAHTEEDNMPKPQNGLKLKLGNLSNYEVEWSDQLNATPRGGMMYLCHFLAKNNLFEDLVETCPLQYKSNNAPHKRSVLGTILCGILEGAWRYAHLSTIKGDRISADALGWEKGFVSEDSVRRGMKKLTKDCWDKCQDWLSEAELTSVMPVLSEPYILDLDTSVKQIYGRQEGAEIGYNPSRCGRPSQSLHVGFIGTLRLLVYVDVQGGKNHAACHMSKGIWKSVDLIPKSMQPELVRGDIGYGNEGYMVECEQRDLQYLFKQKITSNGRKEIVNVVTNDQTVWCAAPNTDYEYACSVLKLSGWSKERDIIILRRLVPSKKNGKKNGSKQMLMSFMTDESGAVKKEWKYAILVHRTPNIPTESIPKLYQERADCENVLDELKNQWGLAGFSTHDILRVKLMARLVAIVCNWWNVFTRMAEPDEHMEALTSRPELLHLIAQSISHAGKQVIRFASYHENQPHIKAAVSRLHRCFAWIGSIAEQLTKSQILAIQMSIAFHRFLNGKLLNVPDCARDGISQLCNSPPE